MSQSQLLLRLQEVDLELMRAERVLQAKMQLKKMEQFDRAERKLAKNALKVRVLRKDLEIELEDNHAEAEKLRTIVAEVQENFAQKEESERSVRELQAHLTHLAKRLEKLEFLSKGLNEKLEQARAAEKNADLLTEKLAAEKAALQARIDEDSADVRQAMDKLNEERKTIVEKLNPELLDEYERCSKKYGGLAVEQLKSNKPSICNVKLQPSLYHDVVTSEKDVIECPYCKRMLVVVKEEN